MQHRRGAPPEAQARHRRGFPPIKVNGEVLENGGMYQWRRDGEYHMWNPETVAKMQHAVRVENFKTFEGTASPAVKPGRRSRGGLKRKRTRTSRSSARRF